MDEGNSAYWGLYVSDETAVHLQRSAENRAKHVFFLNDLDRDENPALAVLASNVAYILKFICVGMDATMDMRFAIVGSSAPFQATILESGIAVVLVDWHYSLSLLKLCSRVQTTSPLAEAIALNPIPVRAEYNGLTLIQIINEFLSEKLDKSHPFQQQQSVLSFVAGLAYAIGHEAAHVLHGHFKFLKSSEYLEIFDADEDKELTLRTLEMDADSAGVSTVFGIFESLIKGRREGTESLPFRLSNITDDLVRRRYVTGVFIATFYRELSEKTSARYPPSYARYLIAEHLLQRYFERYKLENIDLPHEMRKVLISTFVGLSGSLETLRHVVAANIQFQDLESGEVWLDYLEDGAGVVEAEIEPLKRRWSRIRPFLIPRFRLGRLAPAESPPN
jgi:hypothetical protein